MKRVKDGSRRRSSRRLAAEPPRYASPPPLAPRRHRAIPARGQLASGVGSVLARGLPARLWRHEREAERERRAGGLAIRLGLEGDRPARGLHGALDDGEAEAHPARLGRERGLEDLLAGLCRHAHPRVGHLRDGPECSVRRRLLPRAEDDAARPRLVVAMGHRLVCIREQVDERPAQLLAVGDGRQRLRREVEVERGARRVTASPRSRRGRRPRGRPR